MDDRYVISDENKNTLYIDADNLYGWAMSETLPYDQIKFDRNVKLEEILNNHDDSGIGYFIEFDLKYPDNIKYTTNNFPFCPENTSISKGDFSDYMKEIKPDTCTQTKKSDICFV